MLRATEQRGRKSWSQVAFRIALAVKSVDALIELAGSALLWTASTAAIGRMIVGLTRREISEDPNDLVANAIRTIAHHLTSDTRIFAAAYLLVHGLVKGAFVVALWTENLRVFPWAVGVFLAAIGYQIYRVETSGSIVLAVFTALDIAVVYLVDREYERLKSNGEERR